MSLETKRWITLYLMSCLAGLAGGLGAVLFRFMIELIHRLAFHLLLPYVSLDRGGLNLGIALLPALGGLIIGPITMRLAPETKGAGVPEIMEAVALKEGRIRKRLVVLKIAVSSITIGSGGSAGREGPIAQIGASIGSFLGQLFNMGREATKLLVVCGLSAGIAGTYNAPLGGAIFGIEILLRGINLVRAIPVVIASVIGAATAAPFFGQSPAFKPLGLTTWTLSELGFCVLLGFCFGLISVCWVKFFYAVDGFFEGLKIPSHFKPALGGLMTGLVIMTFPHYGVMGVGYEGINLELAGRFTLFLLLALGGLKLLATALTIGSGGSGGIFAPTLYIGAMFGGAFGLVFNSVLPSVVHQPAKYALAGMAALFAGATQAPLNIMIMIPEMSNDLALLPPVMASSVISFAVSWFFLRGASIYTLKLQKRGLDLRMGKSLSLDASWVEDVMTDAVIQVDPDMTLKAFDALYETHPHEGYPVVKAERFMGMVMTAALKKTPEGSKERVTVGDLMSKETLFLHPHETVQSALNKMEQHGTRLLPVLDRHDPDRLVGIVSRGDLYRVFGTEAGG